MQPVNMLDCTHVLVDTCFRKVLEELELPQCPKAEERVLEGQDTLDGDLAVRRLVKGGDNDTVCAVTKAVE